MTRYRKISATIIAAISLSLAAMSAPAVAAGPYYGGLSLGSSELQDCNNNCTDTGVKISGGYQVNPNLAVEIAYADLGKFGNNLRASALGLYAVGKLPVANHFSLLGRVGINNAQLKGGGNSDSNLELGYGIGASYALTPTVDLRGEWERYKFDALDASLFSVGLAMKF
ncbi:MAG: porin family protein [Burkholderiales bacterium]